MECPLPENESKRLQAVRSYDILDTPTEVDFDALARIAAHAFKTPAAVIGLMDSDRLWFKSRFGLDVPQLDRQIAFCAYTIMKPGELLVIEDLQQDARCSQNPLVTQAPHLRFYAGAPLIDPNGYALGTLAVVDVQPRTLTEEQRAVLRDLSTLVITALESRRQAIQLGRLAMTDHLTGLANKAQFERTLQAEMSHAQRTGEPFTMLYMDLDGFKAVNDTRGHAAGDEVLFEIARRLESQIRAGDVLARLGGDEFAVFLRQGTQESAETLARRIAEAVLEPIRLSNGDRVNVGISVGMAAYSKNIDCIATLLALADQALYEEKRKKQEPSQISLFNITT